MLLGGSPMPATVNGASFGSPATGIFSACGSACSDPPTSATGRQLACFAFAAGVPTVESDRVRARRELREQPGVRGGARTDRQHAEAFARARQAFDRLAAPVRAVPVQHPALAAGRRALHGDEERAGAAAAFVERREQRRAAGAEQLLSRREQFRRDRRCFAKVPPGSRVSSTSWVASLPSSPALPSNAPAARAGDLPGEHAVIGLEAHERVPGSIERCRRQRPAGACRVPHDHPVRGLACTPSSPTPHVSPGASAGEEPSIVTARAGTDASVCGVSSTALV